ncbi:MAG: ribose-phosphate pyrophosphokinase [Gammaproteobacteria bacterium RIFCSPHIGHO2_12_FULL_45_9]|nr:MAG: ribose-phosphate pyrophosphokinase [Gammaproteobacteria bacterium RIFCSPHIGHO2_12_FULL_45_9]
MSNIRIFHGSSNPELAKIVADRLQVPLGKAHVGRFSDGEIRVEILENIRGREVFILQSTCEPTNDSLMELILLGDAVRRASAARITAVIPYFGYARQDRRVRSSRVPISAKVVADMLENVGFARVITVDLHADQIQGFFYIPVDNVYATSAMFEQDALLRVQKDPVIVSPDVGGVVRARAIAKRFNDRDLVIIDKRRPGPNQAEVMNVIGAVEDRHCIIVDDLVDTAGTLCHAAVALKEKGARTVSAYCVHPVLSGSALDNIMQSPLDDVVVTDSIPLRGEALSCPKVRQVTLGDLLAETISRIHLKESVSSMFVD